MQSPSSRQHPTPSGTQIPAMSGPAQSAVQGQTTTPEQNELAGHSPSRQQEPVAGCLQMVLMHTVVGGHSASLEQQAGISHGAAARFQVDPSQIAVTRTPLDAHES
jgi:hypothetical protein